MRQSSRVTVEVDPDRRGSTSRALDYLLPSLTSNGVTSGTPVWIRSLPAHRRRQFVRGGLIANVIAHSKAINTNSREPTVGMRPADQFGGTYDVRYTLCLLQGEQAKRKTGPRRDTGRFAAKPIKETMEHDNAKVCLRFAAARGKVDDVNQAPVG